MTKLPYDPTQEPHEPVDRCPACDGAEFDGFDMQDRYGFPVRLNTCACGFRFLGPRMTAAAYERFYQQWYRPLVREIRGGRYELEDMEKLQRVYAEQVANWLGDHIDTSMRSLLDIGGSTGVVAEVVMNRFGMETGTVLDPSLEELARAEERGLRTVPGLAEQLAELALPQADLYLLCQTIDHLLEPRRTLQTIFDAMGRSSWLFVDIVAFNAALPLQAVVKIDHPLYFVTSVMRRMLYAVGFDVIAEGASPNRSKRYFLCQNPSSSRR